MPHKPPDQDDSANKPPSAVSRALRLLNLKARSAAELRQMLAEEGYEEAELEAALASVRGWGYIHDDRLAEAVQASAVRRGRGARWLLQKLGTRKLSGPITHTVAMRHEKEEPALLAELLARRFQAPTSLDTPRDRARAMRFLLGRGFSHGPVMAALQRHRSLLSGQKALADTSVELEDDQADHTRQNFGSPASAPSEADDFF